MYDVVPRNYWTAIREDEGRLKVIGTKPWAEARKFIDVTSGKKYRLRYNADLGNCAYLHIIVYNPADGSYVWVPSSGGITAGGNYSGTFTAAADLLEIRFQMPALPAGESTGYFYLDDIYLEEVVAYEGGGENGGGYRYQFNGKELDKEVSATTTYDYGFRIYSPGLGRFLSVDPLTGGYPWYTPYQFAGNKPIVAIDLDGLEEFVMINWHDVNGKIYKSSLYFDQDAQPLTGNAIHFVHSYVNDEGFEISRTSGTDLLNVLDFTNSRIGHPNKRGKQDFDVEKHDNPVFKDYSFKHMNESLFYEFMSGKGSENTVIFEGEMVEEIMELPGVKEATADALRFWKDNGGIEAGDTYTYDHEFSYTEGLLDIWIPGILKGGVKNANKNNPIYSTRHFLGSYRLTLQVMLDGKSILFSLADSKTKESATDHQNKGNSIDRKDGENIPMSSTYQRYIWSGEIQEE